MKLLITYVGIIGIFFSSCSSAKPTQESTKNNSKPKEESVKADQPEKVAEPKFSIDADDELAITFQQTACFGQCPVHTMEIYKSGKAVYKGDRWVHNVGNYYAILSKAEMEAIYAKAESLSFYFLDASYKANMTDLPTTYIMINSGEQTHTVSAYGEVPDNLKSMIEYMSGLTETISWKSK